MTSPSTVSHTAAPEVHPGVMALAHAIRRGIINALGNGVATPGAVAENLGKPLGVVSYHFRMLAAYRIVEVDHVEPRRGALQHHYKFTADARRLIAEARVFAVAASVSIEEAGP